MPGTVPAVTGCVSDTERQSDSAQQGILWLASVTPAILLIVVISRYGLSDQQPVEMNREIESRHSSI